LHGGGIPAVRKSARERLLAMVDPAFDALLRALGSGGPPCALCGRADSDRDPVVIRAAQIVLDRAGFHPSITVQHVEPANKYADLTVDELIAHLEAMLEQARAMRDAEQRALPEAAVDVDAYVVPDDDDAPDAIQNPGVHFQLRNGPKTREPRISLANLEDFQMIDDLPEPAASGPERPTVAADPPGATPPRGALPQPEPGQPPPGANAAPPGALEPAPAAPEPDPTAAWCPYCEATVERSPRGTCPSCHRFLKGNTSSLKHGARASMTPHDLATRDALRDRLFAERGGRDALDIVSQLRIEDFATSSIQLAKVTRRLEALGAVSTEGRKRTALVETYNVFSARVQRLAAELPEVTTTSARSTSTDAHYEHLTEDALIARLESLLASARELRELGQRIAATTEQPQGAAAAPRPAPPPRETPKPAPPAPCRYCGQTPCIGPEHHLWPTLHALDPVEVARRDKQATAEMFATLGKPHPWKDLY